MLSVRIAEAQVTHLNMTLNIGEGHYALSVFYVGLCIQKLTNTVQGSTASGCHIDQIRHRHDGPDN